MAAAISGGMRLLMEACGISNEHTQFEANKAGILGGVRTHK